MEGEIEWVATGEDKRTGYEDSVSCQLTIPLGQVHAAPNILKYSPLQTVGNTSGCED